VTVRFAAALPKEAEDNGLTIIERALINDPGTEHVIIGVVDTKKIITDTDNADTIPYARFRRVEVITGPHETAALKLLAEAALARNGKQIPRDQQPTLEGDE
jgi:hypothetical protein